MKIKPFFISLLSISMALGAVSCTQKTTKAAGELKTDLTTDTSANPNLSEADNTMTEGDIRSGEFVSQDTIQPVYFDFDMYGLSDATRKTLQKNTETIKTHKDWTVLVEGRCDSRGTVEYNLALGQKRAKEVRDYYVRLGVPESAIGTISYGKEKSLCEEETEDCWAKNRRADTKVKGQAQ
jgi:peptidoglycan-associated lipoprotein